VHNIVRRGVPAGLVIAGLAVALPAAVGAASVHHTFTLGPGQTKTFRLACAGGNADGCNGPHSGRTVIEPPAKGARGRKPNLAKVTIIGARVNHTYTGYSARVHNANPEGTAPVRIKLVVALSPGSS
jgi:hypothetical protein